MKIDDPALGGRTTGAALAPSPSLERWQKPLFMLCLACWVGTLLSSAWRVDDSRCGRWLEGLFLFFATISSLAGLGRRLPLQNVLATAVLIALISGAVISLA